MDALSEYNSAALPYKEERVVVIIQQKDSCHSHQCFLASKHEDMRPLDGKHLSLSLSLSLSLKSNMRICKPWMGMIRLKSKAIDMKSLIVA